MITFSDRLEELQATLELIESTWGVWSELDSALADQAVLEELDNFGSFFGTVIESTLLSTCVGLCRFYDKRPDVLSIPTIICEAAKDPLAKTSSAPRVAAQLKIAWPIVKKVKTLRHKVFAHRDHRLSSAQVFAKAQLAPADISLLVAESRNILNAYSSWFHNRVDAESTHAASSTRDLIAAVVSMSTAESN